MYVTSDSLMSPGREEKKKKDLCKNGRVIRLLSMLEIAFCPQSCVALKLGQRRVLTRPCCWADEEKEFSFGFVWLRLPPQKMLMVMTMIPFQCRPGSSVSQLGKGQCLVRNQPGTQGGDDF